MCCLSDIFWTHVSPNVTSSYKLWNAHLFFVQKHKAHYHYIDVPSYRTIFEETGHLEGTQTKCMTYRWSSSESSSLSAECACHCDAVSPASSASAESSGLHPVITSYLYFIPVTMTMFDIIYDGCQCWLSQKSLPPVMLKLLWGFGSLAYHKVYLNSKAFVCFRTQMYLFNGLIRSIK